MLDRISFYEMMQADTAFVAASNAKNIDKMYMLAAILYRPIRKDLAEFRNSPDWNGDCREPFNKEMADERVKLIKKIPFHEVVAIFLYYFAFHVNELVGNPIFARIFKDGEPDLGLNIGWLGTLLAVSNTKFGPLEQTKNQNWMLVLVDIANSMEIQENREIRKADSDIRSKFKK
jgi:hypothetical protein